MRGLPPKRPRQRSYVYQAASEAQRDLESEDAPGSDQEDQILTVPAGQHAVALRMVLSVEDDDNRLHCHYQIQI
jgi:hypothetical protein